VSAKRGDLVAQPPKKSEYEIRYATADAVKGWRDLAATIRNPLAEARDFLTRTPLAQTAIVEDRVVCIEQVHTSHPNETK